jgi:hypothetical protein
LNVGPFRSQFRRLLFANSPAAIDFISAGFFVPFHLFFGWKNKKERINKKAEGSSANFGIYSAVITQSGESRENKWKPDGLVNGR